MASGNTMAVLLPRANEPPSSNYATFDNRNSILVLEFDATTAESAIFRGVLPSTYAGGGVTIDLYWMGDTATAFAVVWEASWERGNENNQDFDADNFGTVSTATTTTNGTSGKTAKSTITITHANMGSPSAGDPFRLKIRRLASDAGDTMVGDAQLKEIHVKET